MKIKIGTNNKLTCGSVTDFGPMENQAFEQLRFSILR